MLKRIEIDFSKSSRYFDFLGAQRREEGASRRPLHDPGYPEACIQAAAQDPQLRWGAAGVWVRWAQALLPRSSPRGGRAGARVFGL